MPAEQITLDTPDGPMPTYRAVPDAGAVRGGVLVLQDAFGVTDYLEELCRDLAAAGWYALAPHLFHRTGSPVLAWDRLPDGREHSAAMTGEGILTDVDACLDAFAAAGIAGRSVGVVGFCMGGTLGFFVDARRDVGAVASFYGHLSSTPWAGVPSAFDTFRELRAPWLGLFGDLDAMIPIDDVEHLRTLLLDSNMPTEIVRYPHANHAFHRAATPDWHHAESAADAWARTLDWFEAYIPQPQTTSSAAAAGGE
jgi:carboxymethylenebutenolidase